MEIPAIVRYRSLAIAKGFAPVDSGNLRHNAIKLRNVRKDGFTIYYNANDAYYIQAVEEGIKQPAQHFVRRTYLELASQLQNYMSGKPNKFNTMAKEGLTRSLRTAQDTDERKWRNMESRLRANGATFSWR